MDPYPLIYIYRVIVRWLMLLRLLPHAGTGILTAATGLNVAFGLLPVGVIVWMSLLLDRVGKPGPGWLTALGLAIGCLVLQQVLQPFQTAFAEIVARRVDAHCAQRLMAASFRDAPIASLEQPGVLDKLGDVKAAFDRTVPTPGEAAAGMLALISRYAQLAVVIGLIAAVLDPIIALVLGATALLIRFGQRGSLARFGTMWVGLSGYRRRTQYLRGIATGPEAAKEIRVLGLLRWAKSRMNGAASAYMDIFWVERRKQLLWPFIGIGTAGLLGGGFAFVILATDTATGSLTLLQYAIGVQAMLIPIRFGAFFPECDSQTQFGWQGYQALLNFEATAQGAALSGTPEVPKPVQAIRFETVAFRYPGGSTVFEELELEIPVGRSTAIVGLNGAGKTTLVKLLARFYDPDGGRVSVDGVDLRRFDPQAWHRHLSIIFQDFVRYELTAGENIALQENPCSTCLRDATEKAGATFLTNFDQTLFSRYREGRDLSGGQWQRVALARALHAVHSGASILVLDEPTAQLDVRSEVDFFDSFLARTKGLTTIVISHRFSTVRRADNIVVLEHGRVIEQGTHDDLLTLEGRYAKMFRLQSERFQ